MTHDSEQSLDFLAAPDQPGSLGRLGPYQVTEVLGRGGFGVVLKAFDPGLGRAVAIKVLSPRLATSAAARNRFAREAKAAAAVVHDHVVAIHAVDSWNGLPYLVMPYIAGCSLQQRIDRRGPLEVKEVLRIGMQTAVGLTAAHAQGLVHRDVKPSNILLENGVERVKLTDFGLARAVDDASLTQSGVVAGTPQYMSPEQANGEAVDHRSDLFSLGSVLYFVCTGHPPFRANSTPAILRRVCDDRPRNVSDVNPDVPRWLGQIIDRLHAKDPACRFQSAAELADVLAGCLAKLQRGEAILTHLPDPLTRPRVRLNRKTRTAAIVLCSAAAIAIAWTTGILEVAPLLALGDAHNSPGSPSSPAGLGANFSQVITTGPSDSQIVGSGAPASKTWMIADFTSVQIESSFRAEISHAPGFKVITTADDNVLEHLRVVKDGTTLRIGLEPNTNFRLKTPLAAEIMLPTLLGLNQSGSSKAAIRGFKSENPFQLKLSGASETIGMIEAGAADLRLSGSSTVALTGSARAARLSINGASRLKLPDFLLSQCQLDLSGSSSATLTVKSAQLFKAKVIGASTLSGLIETPDIDLVVSGSSTANIHGSAKDARLSVEGASHLPLSEFALDADRLILSASGTSSARLAGKCRAAVLEASGASHLDLGALAIDAADVTLSGASHAKVDVRVRLKYDLSSVSSLTYTGNPSSVDGRKSGGARLVGRR